MYIINSFLDTVSLFLIQQGKSVYLPHVVYLTCLLLMALLLITSYYSYRKLANAQALLSRQKEEILQQAQQLAKTNAVKDKLFSLIGHDLRSPLASIKTAIHHLQEVDQSFPLGRLETQIDTTLNLLTNLLDWAMIQLKGLQPLQRPTSLADITQSAISQASDLISHKQLVVINQVPPDVQAMADPHQLAAIVRNILHNAIKFTPPRGYIRIHSSVKANFVELQIRDTGVGMSPNQLACLFSSPHIRSGTVGEKGTGLGLEICRELIERQGGSLQIDSGEKAGTVVRIRLMAVNEPLLPLA